jgi:endo-1,4-beta-mannosidase
LEGNGAANRKEFGVLLVAFLAVLLCFQCVAQVEARVSYSTFKSGLNYLSSSNRFYQADSVTEADFAYFKANGITDLSIRIFWKSVAEDANVIGNYKRLLAVADKYGLNVQIDFWTQFSDQNWSKPSFINSIYDIIHDPAVKQQWFSFVSGVMNEFKSYSCIKSWTMMNEPYQGVPTDTALFYQCWIEQRALMKSIDNRPVSIRFALGVSPWSGDFSRRSVFRVCDYIAITEYLDPSDRSYTIWGSTWSMFDKCVSDCRRYGKPLVIAEFGSNTGDDEAKRVWYEKSLAYFRRIGIQKAYAWAWQTTNPTTLEGFNIVGKPAFNELAEASGRRVYRSRYVWY